MVKAFAANEDVAFGDVNLSTDQIRRSYNPGMVSGVIVYSNVGAFHDDFLITN